MMTRKQFLKHALGASAAVLGLTLLADCSSSKDSPDAAPAGGMDAPAGHGDCVQNGTNVTIGANHGHVMTVTKADVMAGVQKSYNIQGSADHPHTVTLTAAHFVSLAQNHAITTTSTTNAAHAHPIMVACV